MGTLLDVVTPLDLNFELPSAASLLNASSANSTAAAGLNATAIAFEGLRQTQAGACTRARDARPSSGLCSLSAPPLAPFPLPSRASGTRPRTSVGCQAGAAPPAPG